MGSTLAALETRVSNFLFDASNATYTTSIIDEAIRQMLVEYSEASPLTSDTVITLPGAGREIALDSIANLTVVSDVWYPYDSDGAEVWPPERPDGFELRWDDARPVLMLTPKNGTQPQTNEEMRIFYGKPHTIQNLDSGAATTIPAEHELVLVRGAAGLAAVIVGSNFTSASDEERTNQKAMVDWGYKRISEFRTAIKRGRTAPASSGAWVGPHWALDASDEGKG